MRCGGSCRKRLEALQRQRQVCAALRAGKRVDLVDDHPLDAAQRLARGRGEQQVERLGRGDEDVRRTLAERATLVGGRVAGAHRRRGPRAPPRPGCAPRARCPPAASAGCGSRRGPAPSAATRTGRAAGAADRAGTGSLIRRSRHHRNAASVLPDPVGAQISVCSPAAMAGQPCAWAAVGSAKVERNQSAVAGVKPVSGSVSGAESGRERLLRGTGGEYRSAPHIEQAI